MNDFFLSLLLLGALSGQPDAAPFWQTAGQYGIMPRSSGATALLQAGKPYDTSRTLQWRWGASLGLRSDAFGSYEILPDEAYASLKWRCLSLDAGLMRREQDFLASSRTLGTLSTTAGNVVWSGNAPTVPGYAVNLHPVAFPWTGGRLRFFGRYGDYWTTDNRDIRGALIHNTAFYGQIDIGRRLTATAGFDHYAMWGGTSPCFGKMSTSFANYIRTVLCMPAASDSEGYTEGDVVNIIGNHLGRELLRLDWRGDGWSLALQHDIPYEDRSGMRFENFPDGVNTLCLSFTDKDRWVSEIVLEHQTTMWQSGTHERRLASEEEIAEHNVNVGYNAERGVYEYITGGNDDYFNNFEYRSGWTHYGLPIGDPLMFSCGTLRGTFVPGEVCYGVENNRLRALHLGLSGKFFRKLPYRLLLTCSDNYGKYSSGLYTGVVAQYKLRRGVIQHPLRQFSSGFQCEIPLCGGSLQVVPGIYLDRGSVLPDSFSATLGLRYTI